MIISCLFDICSSHIEITPRGLKKALRKSTWPATSTLLPEKNQPDSWRSYYSERIQLGVLSIYPRTLTKPIPDLDIFYPWPYRMLELLLVPHWSHTTPLRQGIRTRKQRLLTMFYACCELHLLHQTLMELFPKQIPIVYAITHQAVANFLHSLGYQPLKLSSSFSQHYSPMINQLVQRDDPHHSPIKQARFVYAQTSLTAATHICRQCRVYGRRTAILQHSTDIGQNNRRNTRLFS